MSFHIEAYPKGFPHLAVPVIEGPHVSPKEHSQALASAAEAAKNRFREEFPYEKIGGPIVFACHDAVVLEGIDQTAKPTRDSSVVY